MQRPPQQGSPLNTQKIGVGKSFVLMQIKDVGRALAINLSRTLPNSMMLPHALKRIRLHLARSKEFPSGSASHGYEFVAPLDRKGHIDPHLWQKHREHCGVRRFWNGTDEQIGRLLHKAGGAEYQLARGPALKNFSRPKVEWGLICSPAH
jgi:hypothetical protein